MGYKWLEEKVVAPMKNDFNKKLKTLIKRKKSTGINLINKERYQDFIQELKEIKLKPNKSFDDYKMLANYDIIEVLGTERLIQPKNETGHCIKFYVHTDELFGVIHTMHLLYDHASKEKLDVEIKIKFMTSRGGDRLIKLGDFTFTRSGYSRNICYWICYTHSNQGCPAKAYTEFNKLVYARNVHNHPPTEFFV